ncbi:MAG TPA: hypothetical protein VM509_00715, partial [Planctomycetota bacterium]|nr:hypothetical protein [Planctomycetota bacterium]
VPAEKSRKAWWIGGSVVGACAAGALSFQLLGNGFGTGQGNERDRPDTTAPVFRYAEPLESDELANGDPITLKLEFDEPLASATICGRPAQVAGTVAILETVVPSAGRQWSIEWEVVDAAGNRARDKQPRYLLAPKAVAPTPRLLPEIAGLVDGTLYLKEDSLTVRGRVDNASSAKILLLLDDEPSEFELADDGKIDIVEKVAKDKTIQARLEYGGSSQAFVIVQDSRDPVLEIVQPAGSALRTKASSVDVEVNVADDNLLRVELERQPMVDAGKGVFRAAGVALDGESDGEHIFDIVAVDKAGNSAVKRLRVTRDTAGARLLALDPRANSALKPGAPVTLELTFKEDLASAVIDGKPALVLEQDRNVVKLATTVPAGEAPWNVAYDVVDLAENHTRGSVTYAKTNEPPPPEPKITLIPRPPADGALVVGTNVLPLRGTIENAGSAAVILNVAGRPTSFTLEKTGEFVADPELPLDARSRIELSCGSASIAFDVVQDSTAPKIALKSPAQDNVLTKERALAVQLSVDDASLANVTIGTREMKGKGSGTWTLDGLELKSEGANAFEVVATDAVGHTATRTLSIRRDTTPPRLVPASSEPKASTAFAAGKTAACRFVFDEPIAFVNVAGRRIDAKGSEAAFDVDVPISSGPWTIEGTAQDVAGNAGTFSVTLAHVAEPESGGVTSSGANAPKPDGLATTPSATPTTPSSTPASDGGSLGIVKQFAGFTSKPEGANALGFPRTLVHAKTGIELVAVPFANDKAPSLYVSRTLVTKRQFTGKAKADETAQVSVSADEVASDWCADDGRGALLDLPTDAEWLTFAAELAKLGANQVEMLKGAITSTSWPTRDRDGQAATQHPSHGSPLSGFRVVYRVR